MKFAGTLSGGVFVKGDWTAKVQAGGVNATAYAAKMAGGQITVVVLNKDSDKDLELTLDFGKKSGRVESETLRAPALDSREAHIARARALLRLKDGKCTIAVPRASGLRVVG